MTIVQTEDNRNQEWRKSNVGSKLLAKMGWTEGSGIGKRNVNSTALRAVKRQEGLGIGAKRQTEGGPSESTGNFASVLATLKAHHGTNTNGNDNTTKTKKKKKKKSKEAKKAGKTKSKTKLSLPSNKVLAGHARKMREAKFGTKSAEDLACIFGNTEVVSRALGGATVDTNTAAVATKKRPRPGDDSDNASSSLSAAEDGLPNANGRTGSGDDTSGNSDQEPKQTETKRTKEKKSSKKSKKEKKSKKDKKKKSSKSD